MLQREHPPARASPKNTSCKHSVENESQVSFPTQLGSLQRFRTSTPAIPNSTELCAICRRISKGHSRGPLLKILTRCSKIGSVHPGYSEYPEGECLPCPTGKTALSWSFPVGRTYQTHHWTSVHLQNKTSTKRIGCTLVTGDSGSLPQGLLWCSSPWRCGDLSRGSPWRLDALDTLDTLNTVGTVVVEDLIASWCMVHSRLEYIWKPPQEWCVWKFQGQAADGQRLHFLTPTHASKASWNLVSRAALRRPRSDFEHKKGLHQTTEKQQRAEEPQLLSRVCWVRPSACTRTWVWPSLAKGLIRFA